MAALYNVASPGVAFVLGVLLLSAFASCLISYFKKPNAKHLPSLPEKPPIAKSTSQEICYKNAFPPSQRQQLSQLGPRFAGATEIDLSRVPSSSLVKLHEDASKCSDAQYVFSGFSVKEIRLLGTFPDYSILSGVPHPAPLASFDITKAKPRPYRPFRWPYHQTMCKDYLSRLILTYLLIILAALTKLDPDYWIELESTYRERIAQREKLHEQHGNNVLNSLPGSELACRELMEMVLQFICTRYPNQFQIDGYTLVNRILNTRTDLSTTPPLIALLHNVPEDFGIMLRDETTGRYVLRGGMVCSSVGWKLGDKVGLGLPGIHKVVPDYKEKMEFSMDR